MLIDRFHQFIAREKQFSFILSLRSQSSGNLSLSPIPERCRNAHAGNDRFSPDFTSEASEHRHVRNPALLLLDHGQVRPFYQALEPP